VHDVPRPFCNGKTATVDDTSPRRLRDQLLPARTTSGSARPSNQGTGRRLLRNICATTKGTGWRVTASGEVVNPRASAPSAKFSPILARRNGKGARPERRSEGDGENGKLAEPSAEGWGRSERTDATMRMAGRTSWPSRRASRAVSSGTARLRGDCLAREGAGWDEFQQRVAPGCGGAEALGLERRPVAIWRCCIESDRYANSTSPGPGRVSWCPLNTRWTGLRRDRLCAERTAKSACCGDGGRQISIWQSGSQPTPRGWRISI